MANQTDLSYIGCSFPPILVICMEDMDRSFWKTCNIIFLWLNSEDTASTKVNIHVSFLGRADNDIDL